jgi:hypothetical protein
VPGPSATQAAAPAVPAPPVSIAPPATPPPAATPVPYARPAPTARPSPYPDDAYAGQTVEDEEFVDDTFEDDSFADDEPEAASPEAAVPKMPLSERLKRTPPALVILTLAAIGSTGFLFLELASRTAPISVLSSASVVTGMVYLIVTVVSGVYTYRAGLEGRTRLAFLLAFIGGTAAIIAAVSFAGALLLVLALGL